MSSNKVLVAICIGVLALSVLCEKEDKENLYNELLEEYEVIEGVPDEELIIFDRDTNIVYKAKYIDEYRHSDRYDIDAYFAENGKPFRYNNDTKKIEMILED